jgi:phasin family protein
MANPNFEQIAAAQQANAEVAMALVRTALTGVEKLAALNLNAARDFLDTTVSNTQALMGAKDVQDLTKINTTLTQPNVNKMMDYSRNVYDLITQMQKEITEVVEGQYSSFNKTAASAIEKTTASTPVGGDVVAAAMKTMLSASTQAFDNMTRIAKQMADIADANVAAATTATTKAAGSAASATASAAKKR